MSPKKLRKYFNIALCFLLIVFLYLYLAPAGKITYKKNFLPRHNNVFSGQGFIYKLGPADRIVEKNKLYREPGYFYLRTHRNFNQADIKIKYSFSEKFNQADFIDLKLGVLLNEETWNYRFVPLYNSVIEKMMSFWQVSTEDDSLFFQKQKKYNSLNEYLSVGDFSSAILYNYNLERDFIITDYQEDKTYQKSFPDLRGGHVFYAYLKDENLKFDFSFSNTDPDNTSNLDLFVYSNQDIIFSKSFLAKEFQGGSRVDFLLNLPDLPEGVYKTEIRAKDSFIINNIVSYLPKVVFLHKLNLYNVNDGFVVFSNKNDFRIKSLDSRCLSDIKINDELFSVNKIFQQFNFKATKAELNRVESSSCGLLLENSGLFAFSEEEFFNPLLTDLSPDVDVGDYSFLIANYSSPTKEAQDYISEISLDLRGAQRNKGEYRFIISAPFLSSEREDEYLEIKGIEINLSGQNLISKIKNYLF